MEISSDYRDLFKILNKDKIKYLVIGAYAVVFYTEPRFTKDIDIWCDPTPKNAAKLYKALAKFGAPLKGVKPEDFTDKNMVYQMGVAPVRIDIMTSLSGLKFEAAWKRRKKSDYGGININILGLEDLLTSKRKANRSQDILDIEKLTRAKK